MSVTNTYTPDVYNGDGATVAFAATFTFLSDSGNLKVSIKDTNGVITEQTIVTDYTVVGANVTFGTAPLATDDVIIELAAPTTQTSDYTPNSAFPANTVENDFDKLALQNQGQGDLIDRALRVDATSDKPIDLPALADNAGKVITVNTGETGFEYVSAAEAS